MKLTLFSQDTTQEHIDKIQSFFEKPLESVRFLYINTASNYKPYKSDWVMESERKWQKIFPLFQEFDLERAYRIDNNFDFKSFLSSYDYIFVGGGNTFLLSYWMDKTGSREIIKDLVLNEHVVYGGESAGTVYTCNDILFCAEIDNPSKAPTQVNQGLGLLNDLLPIPHWGNKEFQEELENIESKFGKNKEVYKIEDNQALFVSGDENKMVIELL